MSKRFVIVSGANGGIGRKIVELLINEDYEVIALDLSNSNIKDLGCHYFYCDVLNRETIKLAYQEITKITSAIYAIINAVGIFKMQSIIEGNEDDFKRIMDINFFGVYHLNKIFFPLLKNGSRIINITSEVARYSSQPFEGYYNLSKIFLDNYTDVLRREASYLGIQVTKVQCGAMSTKLVSSVNGEYEEMVKNSDHFKEPLTKLKYMMDREITKQRDPTVAARKIVKITSKSRLKLVYRIKNSFALWFIGHLPEKWQDKIYCKVIK